MYSAKQQKLNGIITQYLHPQQLSRFDIINRRVIANIPRFKGGSGPLVEEALDTFLTNCDYILDSLEGGEDVYRAYFLASNANIATYQDLQKLLRETYKPKKPWQK